MLPYNPVKIGVFGSYMRDRNDDRSDINILYRFRGPISIFQKSDIVEELKMKLQKNVNLVSEKCISPYLEKQIQQDLVVIYEDK